MHADFLTRLWASPSPATVIAAVCEATVLDGQPVADLVGSRRAFLPDDLPSSAAVEELTALLSHIVAGLGLEQVVRPLDHGVVGVLATSGPVTCAAVLAAGDDPDVLLDAGSGESRWLPQQRCPW